ncbi:DUF1223 domain-containing protein [Sulfitobacter sp. HNIBRBA2951]|uniref:DUF1223 domain-containing protein n=1 Tax=Sulfitobacter aquimarinus TaxID=3158557 RepID=UPI0032DE83DB
MKPGIAHFAALLFGLTSPLAAEQRPVVVELYTSQGCSSCPPADAILSELSGRSDVIALALHVDYWDYIGWTDEFGDPAHAKRQRAYASYAGRRSVYTPEMIVNGQTDIVGAKPMDLSKAIAEHKARAPRMTLEATRNGDTLTVKGSALGDAAVPMDVHLLRVIPEQQSKITRGENRGSTYEYTNIAHDLQNLGSWDGKSPLDMTVSVTGDASVVVLVQEADAGPIVAAARLD